MAEVPETPDADAEQVNAIVERWAAKQEALESAWVNRHTDRPPVL